MAVSVRLHGFLPFSICLRVCTHRSMVGVVCLAKGEKDLKNKIKLREPQFRYPQRGRQRERDKEGEQDGNGVKRGMSG